MFFQFESQKRDRGQNEDYKRTERYFPKLILNMTYNVQIKPTDIMFYRTYVHTNSILKGSKIDLEKLKKYYLNKGKSR